MIERGASEPSETKLEEKEKDEAVHHPLPDGSLRSKRGQTTATLVKIDLSFNLLSTTMGQNPSKSHKQGAGLASTDFNTTGNIQDTTKRKRLSVEEIRQEQGPKKCKIDCAGGQAAQQGITEGNIIVTGGKNICSQLEEHEGYARRSQDTISILMKNDNTATIPSNITSDDFENNPSARKLPAPADDEYRKDDERILAEYTWALYNLLPSDMRAPYEQRLLRKLLLSFFDQPEADDGGALLGTCSKILDSDEFRRLLLEGWEKGTFRALRNNGSFLSLRENIFKGDNSSEVQPSHRSGNIIPGDSESPSLYEDLCSNAAGAATLDITHESEDVSGFSERNIRAITCPTCPEKKANDIGLDNAIKLGEPVELEHGVNIFGGEFVDTNGGHVYHVAGDVWQITYLESDDQKIAEWFSAVDYHVTHNDIARKRSKHTGQWFLHSEAYTRWCTSLEQKLMWCPGIPGVGKTVMVSLVVDHLRTFDETQTFVGVIYFNYKHRSQQSKLAVLEALCRQTFEIMGKDSVAQALYDSHQKKKTRPMETELQNLLSHTLHKYQICYLIMDALDEWAEHYSDKQAQKLIHDIFSIARNIKLLVTSRVLGNMTAMFRELGAIMEDIIANHHDMRVYLKEKVENLRSGLDFEVSDALLEEITDKVIEASKGRHGNLELNINLLSEQLDPGSLRDVLESLPNGIDDTYVRVMKAIQSYPEKRKKLALDAIMWVAYSQRQLTVQELQHALATNAGCKHPRDYITPLSTITALCAGLIVAQDMQSSFQRDDQRIVKFVHFTTQEFFARFQSDYFENAHKQMYSTCIQYISITGSHIPSESSSECFSWFDIRNSSWRECIPLYDYAVLYWGYHANAGSCSEEVLQLLQQNNHAVQLSWGYVLAKCFEGDCLTDNWGHSIFLAAYHNQAHVLPVLLCSLKSVPSTRAQRTPIHIATVLGHMLVVKGTLDYLQCQGSTSDQSRNKLLNDLRSNVNAKDQYGRTPFSHAVFEGHEFIVKLLLDHGGINVDAEDGGGRTPFSYAAQGGHESIFKLLLDQDINVDTKDGGDRTPFSYAAQGGHESIVKLLLDQDIAIDAKDGNGRTPFSYAALEGHESIVKLLLSHGGIDVDAMDKYGRTPFFYAARGGYESIVKLLLDHGGIDVDAKDTYDRTPFFYAAQGGHESTVKLLLDHGGIDVDAKNKYGRTPFFCAAEENHESIVKLLLNHIGIDVDTKDRAGRTPFFYAASRGHESVVKLLLDHEGINVNAKDRDSRTPFFYAAKGGHKSIVELLLDHGGIDVDMKDWAGRTPFSYAAQRGHESIVKLLLDHGGINIDSQDKYGKTPSLYAAKGGHEAIVKLLLDHGGIDVDAKDESQS